MNAIVRSARDVSPVLELLVPIDVDDDCSVTATVKYIVSYPSIWHRGHGIDPDVEILSATYEAGTEVRSLPLQRPLYDALVDWIEAVELEVN